jgi:hypothetical protein
VRPFAEATAALRSLLARSENVSEALVGLSDEARSDLIELSRSISSLGLADFQETKYSVPRLGSLELDTAPDDPPEVSEHAEADHEQAFPVPPRSSFSEPADQAASIEEPHLAFVPQLMSEAGSMQQSRSDTHLQACAPSVTATANLLPAAVSSEGGSVSSRGSKEDLKVGQQALSRGSPQSSFGSLPAVGRLCELVDEKRREVCELQERCEKASSNEEHLEASTLLVAAREELRLLREFLGADSAGSENYPAQ